MLKSLILGQSQCPNYWHFYLLQLTTLKSLILIPQITDLDPITMPKPLVFLLITIHIFWSIPDEEGRQPEVDFSLSY